MESKIYVKLTLFTFVILGTGKISQTLIWMAHRQIYKVFMQCSHDYERPLHESGRAPVPSGFPKLWSKCSSQDGWASSPTYTLPAVITSVLCHCSFSTLITTSNISNFSVISSTPIKHHLNLLPSKTSARRLAFSF